MTPPWVITSSLNLWTARQDFQTALRWTGGVAVTAAQYEVTRDADATNQLHLNVPTGATFELSVNDVPSVVIGPLGQVFLNDLANANNSQGLTVNQGPADDQALTLKSSDVATGLTGDIAVAVETDDYAYFQKLSGTDGGLILGAILENTTGDRSLLVAATGGQASSAKTNAAARGLIDIVISQHDGANAMANVAANGNIFSIRARTAGAIATRALVDIDGQLHLTDTTLVALTDTYDDVGLVRAFERGLAEHGAGGFIESRWDAFVKQNEDDLVRLGILGAPRSEGGLWNISRHTRLLNGAVWQLYCHNRDLEERVMLMQGQLLALQGG